MASLLKNVASQNITFCMVVASSGAASTSTSTSVITAFVTKDNSQASAGGTFTNLGSGQWNYAPTQAETNCTDFGLYITSTSNIPVNLDFHTDVADGNSLPSVNVVDIAGSAVATGSAQLGVNLVNIAGSAVATGSAQLGVNVVNIGAHAASLDGNNLLKVDVEDIAGNSTAAQALNNSTNSICWGTASGGTASTVNVSTLNNPSTLTDAGQLIGRTIIFLGTSTTANLQGQASNITASGTGSTPTLTFTAMTHAPANGDTFVVL